MAHKYAGIICRAKSRKIAYFIYEFLLGETTVSLDSEERLSIATDITTLSNVKQINEKTLMKRKKIPVFGHPGGGFDFDNTMALW